jgi:hypothetical protein
MGTLRDTEGGEREVERERERETMEGREGGVRVDSFEINHARQEHEHGKAA